MPRAALDPAELLDVDVDQLAGPLALVAAGGLEPKQAQPPQPDPGEDPGDGLLGHRQQLCDLGAGETQAPQRRDRLDAVLRRRVVHRVRRRGAIEQAGLTLGPEAADPLARRPPLADLGGPGRLSQRPILINDPPAEQAALVQAERGVSVQLHPVSSLGLSGLSTSSASKGARI